MKEWGSVSLVDVCLFFFFDWRIKNASTDVSRGKGGEINDNRTIGYMLRSGILGYIAFGGCGVHVPCLAVVYYYRQMMGMSPETADLL